MPVEENRCFEKHTARGHIPIQVTFYIRFDVIFAQVLTKLLKIIFSHLKPYLSTFSPEHAYNHGCAFLSGGVVHESLKFRLEVFPLLFEEGEFFPDSALHVGDNSCKVPLSYHFILALGVEPANFGNFIDSYDYVEQLDNIQVAVDEVLNQKGLLLFDLLIELIHLS